jgi:hypothetical protein
MPSFGQWTLSRRGTCGFRYLASDGTLASQGILNVTVQGSNDAPRLVRPLPDVQLVPGKAFSWRIPAGSFIDPDRNASHGATLANGKPLPSWLRFDAASQTFSGTAPAHAKGNIEVRVTVRS